MENPCSIVTNRCIGLPVCGCIMFFCRSLLVLDDIWIPNVVAAFDVRCTVLMTTRDSGVMSRVSGKTSTVLLYQIKEKMPSNRNSYFLCIFVGFE